MERFVKRAWWMLLIGGIAAIVFGLLTFMWPGATILVLVIFFAASVFVDGIFTLVGAFQNRAESKQWWAWALLGLVGIVAGLIGLVSPGVAASALLLLLAAYAFATGVLLIWLGIKLRKEIKGEWMLWLIGAISIAFGVMVMLQPAASLLGFAWAIGSWAIIVGVLKILLAFKARRFAGRTESTPAAA
jgi:uncharacterized membrane protein HdeD (DUF308 family)